MELLLTRYLWLLDMAIIGICAAVLGSSASSLVAYRLGEAPHPRSPTTQVPLPLPRKVSGKQPNAILRRNIFCSTCPPIRLDGDPEPVTLPDMAPLQPQPTQLPLKLLAVMYAPPPKAHKWNMAVIHKNDRKTVGAFQEGAEVHGATLLSIADTRVYIDNAGATEFLDLLPPPKTAPLPPPRPATPPAQPIDAFSQELDRGIKKLGERRYEIHRSTLESVLGNLALLSRSARIVPEIRGGKTAGFRLFAVRPDGPFAKIGLQNGDVIASINGLEMTSPEKALAVYGKLKSASHLDLGLERNGQKVLSNYAIR
ncbi:MAG TPA: type II secretion system protein GspC [Polyangia bacterium]